MTRKQANSINLLKQGYEQLREKEKEQAEAINQSKSLQLQEGVIDEHSPAFLLRKGFQELEEQNKENNNDQEGK